MAKRDEWHRAIGEFSVTFEHACAAARRFIEAYLPGNSNDDHQRKMTVLHHLEAQQVADTIRALLERTGKPDEARAVHESFTAVIKRRNIVLHSPWIIGWGPPDGPLVADPDELEVVAFSTNRKLKGDAWDRRTLTFTELQQDLRATNVLRADLHRLLALCFPEQAKE